MYNPIINILVGGGIAETALVFILSIPVILTLINFAKYVVGSKVVGNQMPIAMVFVFYSLSGLWNIGNFVNIGEGIVFGLLCFATIFLTTIISYSILQKINLHYAPKISLVLIANCIGLFTLLYFARYYNFYSLIGIDPLTLILLVLISEQILNIFIKKSLSTTLYVILETIAVSLLCFILIANNIYQDILLLHPWIILFTLLINFMIGKFTGLRIMEYFRFYDLLIDKENEDPADTEE